MQIKVKIKTPKGQSKSTDRKIRFWLLPMGIKPKMISNKEDSEIIWDIETDSRRANKIYRNVGRFDAIISSIISSKMFMKQARKKVGDEGIAELKDMLVNQTTCEIIHE